IRVAEPGWAACPAHDHEPAVGTEIQTDRESGGRKPDSRSRWPPRRDVPELDLVIVLHQQPSPVRAEGHFFESNVPRGGGKRIPNRPAPCEVPEPQGRLRLRSDRVTNEGEPAIAVDPDRRYGGGGRGPRSDAPGARAVLVRR